MMRRARGFTLAELVTVIVILAVLAAIAIPQLNFSGLDEAWFHEEVRSGVRKAQRTAVAQRRCVFVVVTPTQLSLRYGDAGCAITAAPVTELATGGAFVVNAPSGIALGASPNPFSFNGLGQPSAAASVSVGARTILVNAETGYVQ